MQRTYGIRLAALALIVPLKWIDNLLSHHELPGVIRSRQGVERRITEEGLLAIEMVRLVSAEIGAPLTRAAHIVRSALRARSSGPMTYPAGQGVAVVFDVARIEGALRERIIEAMEFVARIPRGRPRRDRGTSSDA